MLQMDRNMSKSNKSQRYSHPHSCTLMDFFTTLILLSPHSRARVLLKATVNFYYCLAFVTNERTGMELWWDDSNMKKSNVPEEKPGPVPLRSP